MEKSNNNSIPQVVRINRYLAMAGVCSRRKADELILSGSITINNKVILNLASKVNTETDVVAVGGAKVKLKKNNLYILFNKPKDCITTLKDELGRRTIMQYINLRERVFPVGRLDRNTTGVLLLTNDGDFANNLMHPSGEVLKKYRASLDNTLTNEYKEKLEKGVYLEDGKTSPAKIDIINRTNGKEVLLTIHEGKNRQIHRMFLSLGYEVKKLERVSYARLTIKGIERGKWRHLTSQEIKNLRKQF